MKWEYRTVVFAATTGAYPGRLDGPEFNDKLNSLGDEGWELVDVTGINTVNGLTRDVIAVLKRPLGRSEA